jgi:hypothetical protein
MTSGDKFMLNDVADLPITPAELEQNAGLDLRAGLATTVYRGLFWRNSQHLRSLLFIEVFSLGLILIFVMPVGFLAVKRSGNLPSDGADIANLFLLFLVGSVLILVLANIWLVNQAKDWKSVAKLLRQVDKYNRVVKSLAMLNQLSRTETNRQGGNSLAAEKVLQALRVTKNSLLQAIKIEIIRTKQGGMAQPDELMVTLEDNLTSLVAGELDPPTDQYGYLLDEALQIAMSVEQQMRDF